MNRGVSEKRKGMKKQTRKKTWWIVHTWIGERARYQRAVKAETKPQTQG